MKERRIKKTGIFLASIILLQLIVVIGTSAESITQYSGKDIIVDINGSGDYTSIQKAIDDSNPGSKIYVKNGNYPEVIEIKKSITLIGENKEKTIINPTSQKNKYAVLLAANYITITDFSIHNKASGIYTSAVRITESNNEIDNCNFFDTPIGIVLWSSNNIISNSNFWGCSDEGIALIGSSYSKCEENTIINCTFYDNCDGIELQYSSKNYIADCEFYDNTHTGIDAIASDNNENTITNCKIYDNAVHGIYLSSSHENKIIDCEVYDNEDDNIVFSKYSKNNIITYPSSTGNQDIDTLSKVKNSIKNIIENLLSKLSIFKSFNIYQRIQNINF